MYLRCTERMARHWNLQGNCFTSVGSRCPAFVRASQCAYRLRPCRPIRVVVLAPASARGTRGDRQDQTTSRGAEGSIAVPQDFDPEALVPGLRSRTRVVLEHTPTPIDRLSTLGSDLWISLWAKRGDRNGLAFGGNKVRQLEILFRPWSRRERRQHADHGSVPVELRAARSCRGAARSLTRRASTGTMTGRQHRSRPCGVGAAGRSWSCPPIPNNCFP